MSEMLTNYQTVAGGFDDRVHGITSEQWTATTPSCPEWTVRQLVAHVIGVQRSVHARLTEEPAAEVDEDGDLLTQWAEARGAIEAALADDVQRKTPVKSFNGEVPFEVVVGGLVCADTLVHTWDLAHATGQDETLDDAAARVARDFMEPMGDAMRRPGGFGALVELAPDANAQTRLLNFCGRQV